MRTHRSSAQERARVRLPQAHVALVDAREHLAHERGPGRDGHAQRRAGVPQVVDSEGALVGGELTDDAPQRRDVGGRRLEQVGPVVLVAEQHGVDALADEDLEVAADVVDRALDAGLRVVQR
jgi:hypothetical protein